MDGRASYIIRQLVKAYLTNPQQLPDKTIISIVENFDNNNKKNDNTETTADEDEKYSSKASKARIKLSTLLKESEAPVSSLLLRRICDYIAGMTDQYALSCFEKLYGIKQDSYLP